MTPFKFMEKLYGSRNYYRVFQAADGEDLVILACTVFDWSTRVTDGRTDRQTDGQNCDGYDRVAAFARKNSVKNAIDE